MTIPFDAIEDLIVQIGAIYRAQPNLSKGDLVLRLKKSSPAADNTTVAIALDTFFARLSRDDKFGAWSQQGFFVSALVEQASRSRIAEYRARRFEGCSHILEIGTGTGSDTAPLARVSGHVTTVEVDPVRAELAKRNLEVQGIHNVTCIVGDVSTVKAALDPSSFDGFFADPARRNTDGHRVKDSADYSPPLEELLSMTNARVRAIKVSPGLFFDAPRLGWTREFLGYGDECLEQTLWYGAPVIDSSVFLVDQQIGWAPSGNSGEYREPADPLTGFVSEAHAAINRSQYLLDFFTQRGISQIAPDVAYGVSAVEPPQDPLVTTFSILESSPFSVAKLRSTLHSLGWTNRTEIKKRNFNDDPDEIRSSLKLPAHFHGAPFGTILLFTRHDTPWVIIARRIRE